MLLNIYLCNKKLSIYKCFLVLISTITNFKLKFKEIFEAKLYKKNHTIYSNFKLKYMCIYDIKMKFYLKLESFKNGLSDWKTKNDSIYILGHSFAALRECFKVYLDEQKNVPFSRKKDIRLIYNI